MAGFGQVRKVSCCELFMLYSSWKQKTSPQYFVANRGITRRTVKGGQGYKISHFPIFPFVEISILFHPKQISVVSKSDKQKKKKKVLSALIFIHFPFHFKFPRPLLQFAFFSPPFSLFHCLSFPFPPLFPSPFPFSSFPTSSRISLQTFQG